MRFSKVLPFFFLLLTFALILSTSATSDDDSIISDQIIVVEATVHCGGEAVTEYDSELLSICKNDAENSLCYELLHVDSDGFLCYENGIGEFDRLFDNHGEPFAFADGMTVTIVYDDVSGIARYYVNNQSAYCRTTTIELVHSVQACGDFFVFDGNIADVLASDALSDVSIYNDRGYGTAEIVALQEHIGEKKIRLLAGVDMPWFSTVGFTVCVYENGIPKEEKHISSKDIFESVTADGKPVYASDYGYNYFFVLEISDIDLGNNEYYITARPYTETSDSRHYGRIVGIDIDKNGASFDPNCKTLAVNSDTEFSAKISCSRNIYASVASPDVTELYVYVDQNEPNTVHVGKGRNNILVANLENGEHTVKIETESGSKAKIYSISYFGISCEHIIDATAVWSIEKNGFGATCSKCGEKAIFSEVESPAFMLTFETDVAQEASAYEGFTVVSPEDYNIGADVDGDMALLAEEDKFYIDVDSSVLAKMPYYAVSFDMTVTQQGMAYSEISLFTLISNFRDGAKVSEKKADYAYFFKYNADSKTLSTIDINSDESLLNSGNSISVEIGKQYRISSVVDTEACVVHVFVDGTYIGQSEKTLVDVMSTEEVYPSFRFNDGGACSPIFDNIKIVEIR